MATTTLDPWQVALPVNTTVPAARTAQAAEVIRGMAGSWAASYQFDYGVETGERSSKSSVSNPQQVKSNRLGQPGFPEINFLPYNYGTNRFGPKGGSFVGHPISFSVVGPTLHSAEQEFWWNVVDNSATPAVGDTLAINAGATVFEDFFGYQDISAFPGGLYVVISQSGSGGVIRDETGAAGGPGGIGDGCVTNLDDGIVPIRPNAKYEIFRVVRINNGTGTLTLDSIKHLATYFTIPAVNPVIRGLTLLQPAATRLVALPGSGINPKEAKVFAVPPPKRALIVDDQYKYENWIDAGGFVEPNLDAAKPFGVGTEFEYKYGPKLPIPRPLGYWHGRVRGITDAGAVEAPVALPAGRFILHPRTYDQGYGVGTPSALVGKVIHVYNVQSKLGAELITDANGYQRDVTSLLGWFEVLSWSGAYYILRRVNETDLNTGFAAIGSSYYYHLDGAGAVAYEAIELDATVHDPIETLWTTSYADIDKIQSACLTNLIDPTWVERSSKTGVGTSPTVPGMSPARPDKAIFNTATGNAAALGSNADPGSLLDLGFRMVLYPATVGTELDPAGGAPIAAIVPDWNNPVDSNEILLDPNSPDEKQYVTIDYSNGLVAFSHPILTGSSLYPPNAGVFTDATNNPRGEMVLFACCVPYSKEEGQLGNNVRVTGGTPSSLDSADCGETPATTDTIDLFSDRIVIPVDPLTGPINSFNLSTGDSIILQGDWVFRIPPNGFVELLIGDKADGQPAMGDNFYRGSLYGYNSVSAGVGRLTTILNTVYGGGIYGIDTINPAVNALSAVIRREVATPNNNTGKAGVDYRYDTTYGANKRASAVRFDDAEVQANVDGSVTVRPRGTQTLNLQDNFKTMYSSWILESGAVTGTIAPGTSVTYTVSSHTILMAGHRLVVPETDVVITANGTYYLYYEHNDGTTCPVCTFDADFPLDHPEDILIAKVVISAAITVSVITPLQCPMTDLDRRLDIYVGELGGNSADWIAFNAARAAHFVTLYDAVAYANEMMNPDSTDRAYKKCRIMVIGRTSEPNARLPITIKTDGLTIESTPFWQMAPVTGGTEITWSGDDVNKTLFDLNGHHDLTFRNLTFCSLFADTAQPTYNTPANFVDVVVFSNYNLGNFGLTIEGCRVTGRICNFIQLDPAGHVGTPSLTQSTISSNIVLYLLESGISLVDDAGFMSSVTIENNLFMDSGLATRTATSWAGIELRKDTLATFYDTILSNNVFIRDNSFDSLTANSSFYYGVNVAAKHGEISGNYIDTSLKVGILTAGGMTIRNNTLYMVHIGASEVTWGTGRYGIRHISYLADDPLYWSGKVEDNLVILDNTIALVSPDAGVKATGERVVVCDNYTCCGNHATGVIAGMSSILVDSAYGKVQNNNCLLLTVLGNNCIVSGNQTETIIIGATGSYASNMVVTGNQVYESTGNLGIIAFAERSRFSGNGTSYTLAQDGVMTIAGSHNIIEGNTTGNITIDDNAAPIIGNIVQGNRFFGSITVDAQATYTVIANNLGMSGAGVSDIVLNGSYAMVTGNMVTSITMANSLTNIILNGNMVADHILLGDAQATQADPVIIEGNMVTNHISGFVVKDAHCTVTLGNVAPLVFTAAPAAANVDTNNANL